MDHLFTRNKPPLLMVSHCVPDAVGGADRARAWQLLRVARQSHSVYLACLLDGAVNLSQWRPVAGQVRQLVIQPRGSWRQIAAGLAGTWGRRSGLLTAQGRGLAGAIHHWSENLRFDTVLCTHPAMCAVTRSTEARLRICDLATARDRDLRQGRTVHTDADLIITGPETGPDQQPSGARNTIVLPLRIDPDYFKRVRFSQMTRRFARPGLGVVVHSAWNDWAPKEKLSWFDRRVWPAIKRAVPQAYLGNTRRGPTDPFATLSDASVVVCPDADPARAQLPVLQAMAMQRAVIASSLVLDDPHVRARHGEQLLLGRGERDWIDYCVELLRSASSRLHLAQRARASLERYATLEQTGQPLTQALTHGQNAHEMIHQAA